MTMAQVESQVNLLSFEEQLHLLAYIANRVDMRSKENVQAKKPKRTAGGLRENSGWRMILTKLPIASRNICDVHYRYTCVFVVLTRL